MASSHVSRVRILYKTILRLHKGLPDELRYLGDSYVKEEFRKHKGADPEFAAKFMDEWAKYAVDLSKQLGPRGIKNSTQIGKQLSDDLLHTFREDQLSQLYFLGMEATGQSEGNEEDVKELQKKVDEMQAPDGEDDADEETRQR